AGEPHDEAEQRISRGRLELLDRGDVCLRNDQHVSVRKRLNVEEGDRLRLARDDLCLDLAGDDAAEDAAHRGCPLSAAKRGYALRSTWQAPVSLECTGVVVAC